MPEKKNYENCNHHLPEKARLLFLDLQGAFGSHGVFTERDLEQAKVDNREYLHNLINQGFVRMKQGGYHCAKQPLGIPRGRDLDRARNKVRKSKAA